VLRVEEWPRDEGRDGRPFFYATAEERARFAIAKFGQLEKNDFLSGPAMKTTCADGRGRAVEKEKIHYRTHLSREWHAIAARANRTKTNFCAPCE
jgi:hypothetical protein